MGISGKKASFYESIKGVKKVLVLDLGFLGDTIHLFPAISSIRRALPEAHLEVMVGEHIQGIMKVLPGMDKVSGYPRFPKGPKWYQDLGRVVGLRREKYDAIINLNGSDRSSILTLAIGARYRLGRVPPKQSAFWKYCFTHTVEVPRHTMPVYEQQCECLKLAGFPHVTMSFDIRIPEEAIAKVEAMLEGESDFIHISPFTTLDYKELPEGVLADFINVLQGKGYKLVLSCAPNEREIEKLSSLLRHIDMTPWKVFSGTLNLFELAAVIQKSSAHLGGDSGALHIGLMVGGRTLSWFRDYEGKLEWLPKGEAHAYVLGTASEDGLKDISLNDLVSAFDSLRI